MFGLVSLYLFNKFLFLLYFLLYQKFGKKQFSDADHQKLISDS